MEEMTSTSSMETPLVRRTTADQDRSCPDSPQSTCARKSDTDSSSGKSCRDDFFGDDDDNLFGGDGEGTDGNLFETLSTKLSTNSSSLASSSQISSAQSSHSSSPARRNSFTHSTPDLGTPLNFLFRSSRASSNASHAETPITSLPASAGIVDGLDRLLHRITSERFLELRRIQLGERPVTGGNARTSLETFFQRALHGPTEEQRTAEEEANRPENVANDVQSLLQLSRVRSALQSGFSSRLESTLSFRSAPTTQTRETASQRPRNNDRPQQHRRTNLLQRNTIRTTNLPQRGVPTPPPLPGTPTEYSIPFNPPTAEEMAQDRAPDNGRPSALQSTVDASVEMLAESIATDITRLQSLQVVSSMLRTDFRSELENLVQQRVENVGNGAAVAEIIRSLPRTRRTQQASTPRYNHSMSSPAHENSGYISDEVRQLRHQLDDMKRMMAMSLEMQMDTQRAIRQEVAAVFSAFMQEYLNPLRPSGQTNSSPAPRQSNMSRLYEATPIHAGQCVICIDRSVDTVLYQCGHMCVCHQCGLQLKMEGHKCPMCRAPIRDIIRAYKSQESSTQ